MKHRPINQLFSEAALRSPNGTAIEWLDQRVTYQELEDRANYLAGLLLDAGLNGGDVVGILAMNTVEVVPALLACFKAGGAFVVLDPSVPGPRLQKMAEVAEPKWFFLEEAFTSLRESVYHGKATTILMTGSDSALADGWLDARTTPTEVSPREVEREPDDMCYLYFTSGSTGIPKAIAGRLKALDHFVQWEIETFGIDQATRISQLTAPTFDAYLRDIFTPLCAGGTVCVPDGPETVLDARELVLWLERKRINLIHTVPSLFRIILSEDLKPGRLPDLKYVLLAGEPLLPSDVRRFVDGFGDATRLVNLYGPSETTMIKFCYFVEEGDKEKRVISIGKPISGCKAMILDSQGNPCSPGSVGEIVIRTPFRSLGYFRDPQKTAAAFIQNPFNPNPNDLIYKTGDFGRMTADGNYEALGRMDQQVKIRGVRIELGEIETLLNEHPDISEAAVATRELGGDDPSMGEKHLVAYVVIMEGRKLDTSVLHDFLAEELPETMVPTIFMKMDSLPRLINGKIDRKALPRPEALHPERKTCYVPPRNEDETKMAEIWANILKIEKIGVQDNFFEVGGHSLLATLVLSRVRRAFKLELPLGVLFERRTIEQLCLFIAEKRDLQQLALIPEPVVTARDGKLPLSFAQQRLWLMDKLEPDSPFYNLPFAVRLRGSLNVAALNYAFNQLTVRHEILRTTFGMDGDEPIQVIESSIEWNMVPEQVSESDPEKAIQEAIRETYTRGFKLSVSPLWRIKLLRISPEDHVLIVCMHHIVTDGWSTAIISREVTEFYNAFSQDRLPTLPALPIQYADYSAWQRSWLCGDFERHQIDYWRRNLSGAPELCSPPPDRPRPPLQSFEGTNQFITFDPRFAQPLRELSKANNVTLFVTLFTAFSVVLRQRTGQTDLVIGTDVANRGRAATEDLIGFFVNQMILRTRLDGDPSFIELLAMNQKTITNGYNHQDLSYHKIVEALKPVRHPDRSPLFQVKLALQPSSQLQQIGEMSMEPLTIFGTTTQLDLILNMADEADGIKCRLEYCTALFDETTIAGLIAAYEAVMGWVSEDGNIKLSVMVGRLDETLRAARLAAQTRSAQDSLKRLGKRRTNT